MDNYEQKKAYDWDTEDEELTTQEDFVATGDDTSEGEPSVRRVRRRHHYQPGLLDLTLAGIVMVVVYLAVVLAVVAVFNVFFGPRTYFVSYNYTCENGVMNWGSGRIVVEYAKVTTKNYSDFLSDATNEILKKLHLQDGDDHRASIVSYQEIPRTLKDLLRYS